MQIATVHLIIKRVTNFLVDLAPTIIRFPVTEQERQEKAQEFRNICGIDGIVGAIDGTYIPIRTPVKKISYLLFITLSDAVLHGIILSEIKLFYLYL